ncbi:MAG: serine hydrolase [Cyclobacteriaceae bacterium]|nr:serine hydrolase [Cyclobacteriaceae bacterium]
MVKKVLLVLFMGAWIPNLLAQDKKNQWIDSVFQTLDAEEKIGQLFILPISSYAKRNEIENFFSDINRYHPGGVTITGGGPVGTAKLINRLQKESAIPLMVMMDAENGPGNVLDSLLQFPKPLALGAIVNDSLLFSLGGEIARQMKLLGINVNLAPNADIDLMTKHPFGFYGTDIKSVSAKNISYMNGLQQNGVIAVARHVSDFPEIDEDLEQDYDFTNNQLDTLTFYPFDQLIKAGIKGINTSNFQFSSLDKKKVVPASISPVFISDVLKKQKNFSGLAITDIPYIQRLSGKAKNESEKLAFEIGNDLLIDPDNISVAIRKIHASIKHDASLRLQLDNSVKRILAAKYDAGLSLHTSLIIDNLIDLINSPKARVFNHELVTSSITLVKNQSELIPIKTLDGKKFASITVGKGDTEAFLQYLNNYKQFDSYAIDEPGDTLQIADQVKNYDLLVISVFSMKPSDRNSFVQWMNKLIGKQTTIVASFGNPYDLTGLEEPNALLLSYSDQAPAPMLTAQVIFGAQSALGITPIAIHNLFNRNEGKPNEMLNRLAYGIPEQAEMNGQTLEKINAIVAQAIDSGATPGCNVIIARKGKIIFDKAYGWRTYDRQEPVTPQTIYDLASITKVAATLQTVMFMYEKNIIDINKKLSVYLPELKNTNKKDFIIKDILTHQAGLWPFLPYWLQTMEDSTLLPSYYSTTQNSEYPFPVSKDLFATKVMRDSMWHWIINAKVREKKPKTPYDYTYSDMGFYMMQHLAERVLNQPIQDFLAQNIYDPIGATTTGFLPLERFSEHQIAPTEIDKKFRGSMLVGYVHDQGAAMFGGVAGHAGLFSDANDLAKLGQMWLQEGKYGGLQFFKPETIQLFTQKQYESSRRGLGWDKPTVSDWNGPTSLYASPKTFGHTGFTGTAVWVDPEFDLVFVFLSNRVYPDMLNNKLLTANIRPRIQDIIYQSIFDYCKREN